MAEKKDDSGGGWWDFSDKPTEEIAKLLGTILLLGILAERLMAFLNSGKGLEIFGFWERFLNWFLLFWSFWKVVAAIIVAGCIAWIVYSRVKLQEVISEEERVYGKEVDEAFVEDSAPVDKENERWQRIFEHGNSPNPSDWRLAIIEADIMLEELLRTLGYQGMGVGDMLKSVDPSDMLTLDNAWEAHKVRNRIAHSGQDFHLSERETRRVLGLFESVFREFNLI